MDFISFCRMSFSLLFSLSVVLFSIIVLYLGNRAILCTTRHDIWALLQLLKEIWAVVKPNAQAVWAFLSKK